MTKKISEFIKWYSEAFAKSTINLLAWDDFIKWRRKYISTVPRNEAIFLLKLEIGSGLE